MRKGSTARWWCALTAGLSVWAGASAVHAAQRIPTRLVWRGSECGTAGDFTRRVLARTDAVRFVRKGHRQAVRLRIERRGAGLVASVTIQVRGRARLRRDIQSPDCDDALDALALVVAIGVEGGPARAGGKTATSGEDEPRTMRPSSKAAERVAPREPAPVADPALAVEKAGATPASERATPGDLRPPPDVVPAPSKAGPLPARATPLAAADARAAPEDISAEAPLAPPRPPAPPADTGIDAAAPAALDDSSPVRFGAGVSALLSLGIAPHPLLGGAAWISTRWERVGPWSPELIVSALHQRLDGLLLDNGEVDFALTAAAVSLCPLRLGDALWQARPCATTAVGRLETEGHATFDPRSSDRPWGTLGGALELTALLGRFELRVTLGADAPLVRDGFRIGVECSGPACEADVFHRVAPVIWSGAAGAGIRF